MEFQTILMTIDRNQCIFKRNIQPQYELHGKQYFFYPSILSCYDMNTDVKYVAKTSKQLKCHENCFQP